MSSLDWISINKWQCPSGSRSFLRITELSTKSKTYPTEADRCTDRSRGSTISKVRHLFYFIQCLLTLRCAVYVQEFIRSFDSSSLISSSHHDLSFSNQNTPTDWWCPSRLLPGPPIPDQAHPLDLPHPHPAVLIPNSMQQKHHTVSLPTSLHTPSHKQYANVQAGRTFCTKGSVLY